MPTFTLICVSAPLLLAAALTVHEALVRLATARGPAALKGGDVGGDARGHEKRRITQRCVIAQEEGGESPSGVIPRA